MTARAQSPERALWLTLGILFWGGACGGVYEEVAPPQKRVVAAVLVPDFVRGGDESREVVAFIDVDARNTYLLELPIFGEGIFVTGTDTSAGCTTSAVAPADFEVADPLRICLELQVDLTVATGERAVVFELRSSGEAVVAEASFFVLPPLR